MLGGIDCNGKYSIVVLAEFDVWFSGIARGSKIRGSGGRKSPRGVQRQSPGGGLGA